MVYKNYYFESHIFSVCHLQLCRNMSSIRILKLVGLEVGLSFSKPNIFKHISELWGFLPDTVPVVLAFYPSPLPFQPYSFIFVFFFWFCHSFPQFPLVCLLSSLTSYCNLILFFFLHSSNIPQLVWSLKSEEFKDASLIIFFSQSNFI